MCVCVWGGGATFVTRDRRLFVTKLIASLRALCLRCSVVHSVASQKEHAKKRTCSWANKFSPLCVLVMLFASIE